VNLSKKDKGILRDLAKKVAVIGNDPVQKQKAAWWTRHNDLQPGRPLVLIFPEGAWREMLTDQDMTTESPEARGWEWDLRARIYSWDHLRDDNVIEPVMACYAVMHDTGYGVEPKRTRSTQLAGTDHFDPVIKTEEDIEKIKIPEVTVDREASDRWFGEVNELFGDILTVERRAWAYTSFQTMDEFAQWRGLDQMLYDLADRPEWIHRVMEKLYEGMVARHEAVMKSGLVTLNNRNHYTGSGGTGYTAQLPQKGFDGSHVRAKDLWGMATTQMFSEVSPEMHEEFALRYERRYLARFGLNCYGCCEPLHNKLDIVKTIPHLRRISISPWADIRKSAEGLGNQYVFSWKPNPAVMAGETWNPGTVRQGLRETLEATRGCVVEMIMKDTHTCRSEPQRMWDWVKIALEVAEEFA